MKIKGIYRHLSRSFVVALCVASVSSVDVRAQQTQQSYLFLSGVGQYLLGNGEQAVRMLGGVVHDNASHAPANYYLGKIAAGSGDVQTAKLFVEKAVALDSTNSTYNETLVELLLQLKQYEKAEQIISKLRAVEPDNAHNYVLGAALLIEIGRSQEALDLCREHERKFGLDERIVDIQRAALINTRNYYTAEEYMQRVVAAFPTSISHMIALGDLNAALGRDSVAVSLYDRAISVDSLAPEPLISKANYFNIKNLPSQYIEALVPLFANHSISTSYKIKLFEERFFKPEPYRDNFSMIRRLITTLLFCEPQNSEVRLLFGRYLTYTGQVDAAMEHYNNMVEQTALSDTLYERILQIHFYKEQYDSAIQVARKAFGIYRTAEFLESEAIALWLGGDNSAAIKRLNGGIRLFRVDSIRSGFYALQGDIFQKQGQLKRCYQAYDKSLRLNADNAAVLNNYAYFLSLEKRDLQRALSMAERANELSADNSTYLDTKAWILFELGQYVDAQIIMRRALALEGKPNAELLLHYGDILYALGDDFLARNYWRKALEAGADVALIDERVVRPKASRTQ